MVAIAVKLHLNHPHDRVSGMLERKTTISSHVLTTLESSSYPLSVPQIMDQLNQKELHPNKTTIYRILEKLAKKNVVTEVTIRSGTTYYEFSNKHHHHHFICNECETVFCLDTCHVEAQQMNLSSLLPSKQFKIQSHDFNLYGTCEPCST